MTRQDRSEPSDPERVLRIPGLSNGAVFADRYVIRRRLGSGAVGEVYRAMDRAANQEVALKVLYPGAGIKSLERLRRELRVVRRLSHPGILRVWDIGEHEGLSYLVSEILEGESLRARLDREGRLGPGPAEAILRDVLQALDHAHRNGVVHRDIKPSNIFLTRRPGENRERAVLLDFGLARHPDETGDLTATGRFVGTPQYCAPEQIRGEEDVGAAADLYATGITLWEMLAGAPPFRGGSDLDVLTSHLERLPPHPSREMPTVPSRLRALALHLIEKRPKDRPGGAGDAIRLLGAPRGVAGLREAAAWLRHVLEAPRVYGLALTGLAALAALTFLSWWLLIPVEATVREGRLVWLTRMGFETEGPAVRGVTDRPVSLRRKPWHPFPSAYVPVYDPMSIALAIEGPRIDFDSIPPPLEEIAFPSNRVTPVNPAPDARSWFGHCPYPNETSLYSRAGAIEPAIRGPIVSDGFVTYFEHVLNYPSKVVEFDDAWNPVGTYHHPGRPNRLYWFPSGPNRRPRVLVSAMNNLIGPRNVLFALDLPLEAGGQAPPYTGARDLTETAAWYLPLPASAKIYAGVTFHGEIGTVAPGGGTVVEFDLANGVPLSEELRGGLSADAWVDRRAGLWRALADAAGLADLGATGDAAELLEAFATLESGGEILRSIPWYRAAILRLEDSTLHGVPALEQALSDVRKALRAERAPRYELLEAEILVRLDRREEARDALRRVWSGSTPYMYRFEWLLLNWRIGEEPSLELVTDARNRPREEAAWQGAMRLADALREGRPHDALAVSDTWSESGFNIWDIHHVLAAQAALLSRPPDPERALEYLDRAEWAVRAGLPMPLSALRLAARRLGDPSREPPPEVVLAVERERDTWQRWVARSPEAWFLDDLLREIESR